MRYFTSTLRILAGSFLLIALVAVGCSDSPTPKNTNTAEAKKSTSNNSSPTETPADAKPMGAAAPGFYTIGEDADVTLKLANPQDGQVISGNSVAPTFNITDFPIYKDAERNRGQSVHVILDNQPYYSAYNPKEPFKPADGAFDNLKEGLHTLRVFPVREWHESIKKEDGSCFDFITFYVKAKSAATVDRTKPLLTYSKPEGEYRWRGDIRGVMIDYYVSNARISQGEYKVRYTINDSKPQLLSRWDSKWIKWEELSPGEFTIRMELVDKENKHVPFKVGNTDYNQIERKFKILAESEKPSKPDN